MYRAYLATAFLALGLYGYAQLKGWSVFPSEAQEYQSQRAGSFGRGGGGFSGK